MVVPGQTAAQAQESTTITVLHDTHFHGNFEDDDSDIARYFALAEERMAEKEHALSLGNGDDIAPPCSPACSAGTT